VAVSPDQVSLGVLVTAVDRDVVDSAVSAFGVGAKRSDGKIPPHVVAYLTMGLCLFPDDDYEEVAQKVTGSLDKWGCWDASWSAPSASAITQARKRLGSGVMREIFESVATPIAGDTGPLASRLATGPMRGAFLRSWRVMAIDGFDVDVPDTASNAEEFGYAGSGDQRSAYPKVRVVALAECGTHAFVAAEVDAYTVGEKTLAARLYPRLQADELLTADRGFYSFQAWGQAADTGAQLLWRAPTQLQLPVIDVLPDGTYVSVLIDPKLRTQRREATIRAARDGEDLDPQVARLVRVIEYDVPDRVGNGHGELIVLLSTILDPEQARPDELAVAYNERWEEETANDQLKTHLRGPGRILRSRLPDLVRQEIWAWLTVHYAISVLIARAAQAVDKDPDRVSYARALRIIRRGAEGAAAFPP
jgi:hypothetical protein